MRPVRAGRDACVTMLPASLVTHAWTVLHFDSSFHDTFWTNSIAFRMISMMHFYFLPRECRLTQLPQWQQSSIVVKIEPASSTSRNPNRYRLIASHGTFLASIFSILVEHRQDAFVSRLSTPAVQNDPAIQTLRRSVTSSNWRSLENQRNGSFGL